MNRIILLGNGFDLAHGLKTSYQDFIIYYWENLFWELEKCPYDKFKNELCSIELIHNEMTQIAGLTWKEFLENYKFKEKEGREKQFLSIIKNTKSTRIKRTPFFEEIEKELSQKRWVDIENKYYEVLKRIFRGKEYTPQTLNKELEYLTNQLIAYLKDIQDKRTINEHIKKIIYEPFRAKDIALEGQDKFKQFISSRWERGLKESHFEKQRFVEYYGQKYDKNATQKYIHAVRLSSSEGLPESDNHYFNVVSCPDRIADLVYFLLPENVLLLNFNYTNTAELYADTENINYIHGKLDSPASIIFGYGDEIDKDYDSISELNDNEYLKNIKSIRYSESDNYRKLLEFISSAPFQLCIMGHSCGTSDRTLLNTLFEHENCISIKPYFYRNNKGNDNYRELIQNISRCFTNKRQMRDRVVNKTFCEPFSLE